MRKCVILFLLIVFIRPSGLLSNDFDKVIKGQTFTNGLELRNEDNILIDSCTIINKNGNFGLLMDNCKNVVVRNCNIRNIGNESYSDYWASILPKDSIDYPQTKGKFYAVGIKVYNSKDVKINSCEIMDVFGQGILVEASKATFGGEVLIENCRIAYIYDDGIKFTVKDDQYKPNMVLPYKGGIIRNNIIHDIGLGISQLPYARHGMYLKSRDILVEGNTVYNCFYGQGISLRNAGIIRNNRIWNCYSGCINYWAQTNTEGSSKKVIIHKNQCRQDYNIDFFMRHIEHLNNVDRNIPNLIQVAYVQNQVVAYIKEYEITDNICILGHDYKGKGISTFSVPYNGQKVFEKNNSIVTLHY